jgi:hypothetical protein
MDQKKNVNKNIINMGTSDLPLWNHFTTSHHRFWADIIAKMDPRSFCDPYIVVILPEINPGKEFSLITHTL